MRRMKHLALAVLLVACGKDKDKDKEEAKPEPKSVEAPKPPPERPKKKATTAAALGKQATAPFGKVEKVKLGMSEADAKAALPELFAPNGIVDEENALTFKPVINQGRLWKIEIKSTSLENMETLATEAWGAGKKAKGVIGEVMYWFDPATNTRAVADSSDLDLDYYVPLEQMLGEPGKVDIAALPHPILNVTREQLAASYGPQMKPDDKLIHIYLPPTEYERDHVSVFVLDSDRTKKTKDYSIELSYGADVKVVKEEMLAAFKKKWGEPKVKKSYGSDDDNFIFHSKNPLIEVKDWGHNNSWRISVRQKDDACGGPCYKGL